MKVEWISFIFFAIAALIHVGFFIFESFIYQKKDFYLKLGISESEYRIQKPWALNQGFYNLYLAVGTILGLYYVLKLQIMLAGVLISFCGLSMIVSGIVLWFSVPQMRRAALLQMLPPAIGFIFLFFHISAKL